MKESRMIGKTVIFISKTSYSEEAFAIILMLTVNRVKDVTEFKQGELRWLQSFKMANATNAAT